MKSGLSRDLQMQSCCCRLCGLNPFEIRAVPGPNIINAFELILCLNPFEIRAVPGHSSLNNLSKKHVLIPLKSGLSRDS